MKFIDREKELRALDKFWREDQPQFIVIYGKRRVGKTELIKQFIKDKPRVYFLAQAINEHENLKALGGAVGEAMGDETLSKKGFDTWKEFFSYIRERLKKKMVLAIDEFPYLAEANKGIPSIFQAAWDEHLAHSPLFLILCGSSIGMMEKAVLAYKAPLYGRRTGQILLEPFAFSSAREFYPSLPFERSLELYSIAGGNPSYLNKLDGSISLSKNIEQKILPPESFLFNEIGFILREELREPRNYMTILKAIALGKHKIGEIVNETGLAKGILHKYLFTLEDLYVVHKEVPVTEKIPLKSRKGIYKLRDQFFKFWFKYILPNQGSILAGNQHWVLDKILKDIPVLIAENYESVARELVWRQAEKFFPILKIGRWWDRNEEIDIVALNDEENAALFGEVKWSGRPVGTDIYENLKEKASRVQWGAPGRKEYYCLFSKSGFTPALLNLAGKEKISLFHQDKLLQL